MKIFKIKNKKGSAPYEAKGFRSGFILLFAVTLSAIILSITLGVANITYKEVSFSTSARDSNDAFFAADTGAECALFYDKLGNTSFPIDGVGAPASINCAGRTATVASAVNGSGASYSFIIHSMGSLNTACAKVNIVKNTTESPAKVTITSTGYNVGDESCISTNSRRVERELIISSFVGATPIYVQPAWIFCANEGEVCSFPGNRQIRYGANGSYFEQNGTNSINCNNATFGDPISGIVKSCDYSI